MFIFSSILSCAFFFLLPSLRLFLSRILPFLQVFSQSLLFPSFPSFLLPFFPSSHHSFVVFSFFSLFPSFRSCIPPFFSSFFFPFFTFTFPPSFPSFYLPFSLRSPLPFFPSFLHSIISPSDSRLLYYLFSISLLYFLISLFSLCSFFF